jgi:hypothetical protein
MLSVTMQGIAAPLKYRPIVLLTKLGLKEFFVKQTLQLILPQYQ